MIFCIQDLLYIVQRKEKKYKAKLKVKKLDSKWKNRE